MVTFAKRLCPSTKFEVRRPSRSEDTAHLVCQLSIYNSFPIMRTTIAKNRHFYVPRASFFLVRATLLVTASEVQRTPCRPTTVG